MGVQEGKFNSHRAVAIVEDINTATQIENILFKYFDLGTARELLNYEHIVSLKTKDIDIITEAQVAIATDKNIDISKIKFISHNKIQKTKEKAIHQLSKELRNKIIRVVNVIDAVVDFNEITQDENDKEKTPEILVYITTTKCADRLEIIRSVQNIILGSFHNISEKNIWIEFVREDCANKEIGTKCEPKLVDCK